MNLLHLLFLAVGILFAYFAFFGEKGVLSVMQGKNKLDESTRIILGVAALICFVAFFVFDFRLGTEGICYNAMSRFMALVLTPGGDNVWGTVPTPEGG